MKETAEAPIPRWSSTQSPAGILFAAHLSPDLSNKAAKEDNIGCKCWNHAAFVIPQQICFLSEKKEYYHPVFPLQYWKEGC